MSDSPVIYYSPTFIFYDLDNVCYNGPPNYNYSTLFDVSFDYFLQNSSDYSGCLSTITAYPDAECCSYY